MNARKRKAKFQVVVAASEKARGKTPAKITLRIPSNLLHAHQILTKFSPIFRIRTASLTHIQGQVRSPYGKSEFPKKEGESPSSCRGDRKDGAKHLQNNRKVPALLDHNQDKEELDDNAGQSELYMRIEQEVSEEEVGGLSEEVGSQQGNEGKKKPKNLRYKAVNKRLS